MLFISKVSQLVMGWSREIDAKNRLIYCISADTIEIAICGGHYGDK